MRLGSVLELLTNTEYSSYEVTVRRASNIFEDRDYQFQVLQYLRKCRNDFVNHDASDSGVETNLYQLKNVVEALIKFHLGNNFGFSSIQEVGTFLSLPRENQALVLRNAMSTYALRFRGYK